MKKATAFTNSCLLYSLFHSRAFLRFPLVVQSHFCFHSSIDCHSINLLGVFEGSTFQQQVFRTQRPGYRLLVASVHDDPSNKLVEVWLWLLAFDCGREGVYGFIRAEHGGVPHCVVSLGGETHKDQLSGSPGNSSGGSLLTQYPTSPQCAAGGKERAAPVLGSRLSAGGPKAIFRCCEAPSLTIS